MRNNMVNGVTCVYSETEDDKTHLIRKMVQGVRRCGVEVLVEELPDTWTIDLRLPYGTYSDVLTCWIGELISLSSGMSTVHNFRREEEFILTLVFNLLDSSKNRLK